MVTGNLLMVPIIAWLTAGRQRGTSRTSYRVGTGQIGPKGKKMRAR